MAQLAVRAAKMDLRESNTIRWTGLLARFLELKKLL